MEPGIYIPEENLGVRIEDDVLITETGNKLLSARLPRSPDEIERLMAAHEELREELRGEPKNAPHGPSPQDAADVPGQD